ncbi:VIT family-domain-containing protein [Kockovaella imperatae]|uniref:VIT family-domain-containing protein n=1 Tax=Kockovaella imperatae TaxID=4999 RepID=A0A1Y1UIS0_9TREE|nr:VIT family-domain-containing protein [Kockovaella imperatae]ORX37005.1 VIT family-domain-containing protein [Kockovaella imperatae]
MAIPITRPQSDITPVWTFSEGAGTPTRAQQLENLLRSEVALEEKCGLEERKTSNVCCKELKDDDERHLISPEIVRDIVIGLSDGLTVPFALTAGLSSIGSSRLVVTAGLAELCAGAISMGLGGFLASQAELDHFHYLRRQTHNRVTRSCAGQMEREVHSILGPFGVTESVSRLVAEQLSNLESLEAVEGIEKVKASSALREQGGDAASTSLGLTAFLLKIGEGMDEVPVSRLWVSAFTIGMSYFIGGLIPLIPYMAHANTRDGLIVSAAVTGAVLFVFGAFKTYFTGAKGGWRGYLYGAMSTLIVGALGAGAAYGLVRAMDVKEA